MMDILRLYHDHGVPHETEGHKHCRPGWVNTACPFCTGNPGLHLGATLDGAMFVCWRCGWKPSRKALARLLGVREGELRTLLAPYGGTSRGRRAPEVRRRPRAKALKFPTGTGPMNARQRRYLSKRGFDPDQMERYWGLLGTGPASVLDQVNYRHRILVPILWDGQVVSFQTRDITGRHPAKYLACPEERELLPHKHLLYGRPTEWKEDVGLCVEGVTDVWRLGGKAFATFGIKYTHKQLRLIARTWRRVIIIFDNDPAAQSQARLLAADLAFRGVDTKNLILDTDPGDLSPEDAAALVRDASG